jgi:ribA/ribD-fused uncharacterized protein
MKEFPAELYAICFSPFSAHAIEFRGKLYPTVEHAYHCLRFSDEGIAEEIRSARSPESAWELSQTHKPSRAVLSEEEKLHLMTVLDRAKLEQHPLVKEALRSSDGLLIVKRIAIGPPGDGFWDIADGAGRNEAGKIWMKLRDELQG